MIFVSLMSSHRRAITTRTADDYVKTTCYDNMKPDWCGRPVHIKQDCIPVHAFQGSSQSIMTPPTL